MIENGKISPLQFGIAVFMCGLGSAALLMPSIVVSVAKEDAWISVLLTIVVDIMFISLWTRLAKRYPDESIVQYSERILGKWLGKLVSILYVWFFLYISAMVLRNVGGFVTTSVLRQTPQQVVQIIFMLSIIYGAYLGLEVIVRAGEVFFPWVIVVFLITTLLLLNHINLNKLLPVLPEGWQTPIKGLYPLLGFPISELVILLVIFPLVDRPKKIKKYFTIFAIMTALFGTLIVMMNISVLGVDITARSPYATFELAKEIRVGTFFERVEVLVGFIWIMTIFVKLAISFYIANLASAQLFHLKSYRVTILPYGLLVVAMSILVFHNPAEFSLFTTETSSLFNLIYGLFIPILLLVIAKIRKKSRGT